MKFAPEVSPPKLRIGYAIASAFLAAALIVATATMIALDVQDIARTLAP
jgi:hypothetical protein